MIIKLCFTQVHRGCPVICLNHRVSSLTPLEFTYAKVERRILNGRQEARIASETDALINPLLLLLKKN
jgi:hypothetical protein